MLLLCEERFLQRLDLALFLLFSHRLNLLGYFFVICRSALSEERRGCDHSLLQAVGIAVVFNDRIGMCAEERLGMLRVHAGIRLRRGDAVPRENARAAGLRLRDHRHDHAAHCVDAALKECRRIEHGACDALCLTHTELPPDLPGDVRVNNRLILRTGGLIAEDQRGDRPAVHRAVCLQCAGEHLSDCTETGVPFFRHQMRDGVRVDHAEALLPQHPADGRFSGAGLPGQADQKHPGYTSLLKIIGEPVSLMTGACAHSRFRRFCPHPAQRSPPQ